VERQHLILMPGARNIRFWCGLDVPLKSTGCVGFRRRVRWGFLYGLARILLSEGCRLDPRIERRTSWAGKDSIDHQRGAHDDLANSATSAIVAASANGECIIETGLKPLHRGEVTGDFVRPYRRLADPTAGPD
jgi:hypothetical protein